MRSDVNHERHNSKYSLRDGPYLLLREYCVTLVPHIVSSLHIEIVSHMISKTVMQGENS